MISLAARIVGRLKHLSGDALRFLAWWAGLSAFIGTGAVCPFCGQAGCPGGVASGGLLSAVTAAVLSLLHRAVRLRSRPRPAAAAQDSCPDHHIHS